MRSALSSGGCRAFTLLEVTIAILIAMVVLGVGVISLKGVDREAKIRRVASHLELSARTAMRESLLRKQALCIRFGPDGFTGASSSGKANWKRLPKGGIVEIRRWGESRWRKPQAGEAWWFRPGQPCEPLAVRLTLNEGRYEMTFDPLTASVLEEGIAVNP
jgi:type II secretory pathway pseudopilin PulG